MLAIAAEIEAQAEIILAENAKDIEKAQAKGLEAYLLDRLMLNEQRVNALAEDTRKIADLPDPVGSDFDARVMPNGMRLAKRRMPIGVLGVIYEARPNVTIDVATLALKTGNASILRGGSETLNSNWRLLTLFKQRWRSRVYRPVPSNISQTRTANMSLSC